MSKEINVANRTIFCRDNLEVLRGINSACVDLIYLDPPFNKKKTFTAPIGSKAEGASFEDIFRRESVKDEWLLLIEHKHPDIFDFINAVKTISRGDYNWCYLAYMAVRLLECHRVLKDTGSLYLHCDPTMSHYLKLLLDCIFGANNFRDEIIWQRYNGRSKGSQHLPKSWGGHHDTIFFLTKTSRPRLRPFRQIPEEEVAERFPKVDDRGRRYTNIAHFRGRNMGARPNLCYEWRGFTNPHPSGWRVSKERLEAEYQDGAVVIRPNGSLERRRFYNPETGVKVGSVWTDIDPPPPKQQTDYPTQKPLALMERIIEASSNKGDVVLDPFCGCATTCVAAEYLERRWVGVDISPKAYNLVNDRLNRPRQLGFEGRAWKFKGKTIQRTDIPARTDTPAKPKHSYAQMKRILFKEQSGKCALCKTEFDERNLEIDHFYPKSLGGVDDIENRQLLCGSCNRIKGNKSMEEAIAIARERGLVKAG